MTSSVLHDFFCWFSNVSCVFITFVVDFRVYHSFSSLFVGRMKKLWKHMIHWKINKKSNENVWYIWKSTKKVMQTLDTFEIVICDLTETNTFFEATWRKCDRVARSQIKISNASCVCIYFFVDFRLYQAFASLFCWFSNVFIMRFHYFVWVASKSNENAWNTRKSTKNVMNTHDTSENQQNK